jgi:hypothetical protein
VFDLLFPVNSLVVLGHVQPGRLPTDSEYDLGKVLVIQDFRAFLGANVSGITVAGFIIFSQ